MIEQIENHMLAPQRGQGEPGENQTEHQQLGHLKTAGQGVVEQLAPQHIDKGQQHHAEQAACRQPSKHFLKCADHGETGRRRDSRSEGHEPGARLLLRNLGAIVLDDLLGISQPLGLGIGDPFGFKRRCLAFDLVDEGF